MMSKMPSGKRKQRQSIDLESQLGAYYGPALPEQPLPSSSWRHVYSRLGRQRCPWLHSRHFDARPALPADVNDAFIFVQNAARLHYYPSLLTCTYTLKRSEPLARVVPSGRRRIELLLPSPFVRTLDRSELQVLIATGLAQYRCFFNGRFSYALIAALALASGLLACATAIVCGLLHLYGGVALLLIVPVIVWSLHTLRRRYARQADALIVQWLGRSQVCQGLHRLARYSATANRKRWGYLSLAERIEQICGTEVEARDERLTLVR